MGRINFPLRGSHLSHNSIFKEHDAERRNFGLSPNLGDKNSGADLISVNQRLRTACYASNIAKRREGVNRFFRFPQPTMPSQNERQCRHQRALRKMFLKFFSVVVLLVVRLDFHMLALRHMLPLLVNSVESDEEELGRRARTSGFSV